MLAEDYSKAVCESLSEGADVETVLTKLGSLLAKRGHTKLRASILRNVLQTLELASDKDAAVVTVARSSDVIALEDKIKNAQSVLSVTTSPRVSVQQSVIGGFNLSYKGKRIDTTYRTALFKLYKNITS